MKILIYRQLKLNIRSNPCTYTINNIINIYAYSLLNSSIEKYAVKFKPEANECV